MSDAWKPVLGGIFVLLTATNSTSLTLWHGIAAAQARSQTSTAVQSHIIRIPFSVVNDKEQGNPVPGLKKDNFRVFEDGVPQVITEFSEVPDPPLSVAVLLDASGSARGRMKLEQAAAADLFEYLL